MKTVHMLGVGPISGRDEGENWRIFLVRFGGSVRRWSLRL